MTKPEKTAYGVPAGQAAQISNTGKISTPGAPMISQTIQSATEKQQDVGGYVEGMETAAQILNEIPDYSPIGTKMAGNVVTRLAADPKDRQAFDAQLMWTWNLLRAESGATVTKEEAAGQMFIYWPQPGDDKQTKENKNKLRKSKENAMRRRAGKAYKPQGPLSVPSGPPVATPPPPPGFRPVP